MMYTVDAIREGRWWALQCREVPGAISQVVRLDQAEETIREAIAWVAQVPESDVQVCVVPQLPSAVAEKLRRVRELRDEAAEANASAATLSRHAISDLLAGGLSMRDAGQVLGISHQRVAQLKAEADAQSKSAFTSSHWVEQEPSIPSGDECQHQQPPMHSGRQS